ncbi:MAG TPA: hypothetical protein PLM24_06715 [Methanothrix sp.]|nr:hypothetical protein [Methanothrix sp.]HPJ85201.1 hypothetical protein [Methanothrix sp.]HPR66813.1 hypothetical protein [Methanothrix sp.]
MKIAIMPCRSAPRGLKMFFGFLLLCLLTCMPAAAQEENITGVGGEFYGYAEFSFAVPKELEDMVEAEYLYEENYTEGKYVAASLLFNDSRVWILLIYPCDAPQGDLDAAGLKSAVDNFNTGYNQTVYSPIPLNISDRAGIAGQIGNQILVAYQPSNQTVSVILMDVNVTENFLEYFPQSLQINVNEDSSPLWPGYCAGDEVVDVSAAQVASDTVQAGQKEQTVQQEQTVQAGSESSEEQVGSELAAIGEQFEQTFGRKLSF